MDAARVDSFDVLEALVGLAQRDALTLPLLVRALYSDEERQCVLRDAADDYGHVSINAVAAVAVAAVEDALPNLLSLAYAIAEHEGALRASLQAEYGIRLLVDGHGRTEPQRSPREVADLVEHLPFGCALWRAVGGQAALSNESRMIRELEFTTRIIAWQEGGKKGTEPKRIPLPEPAGKAQQDADALSAKAAAWEARQARRAVDAD